MPNVEGVGIGTKRAPLAVMALSLLLVLSSCGTDSGREGDGEMEE